MNVYNVYSGTVGKYSYTNYLTMSAILTAVVLIFYVLVPARAEGSSVAKKIEEKNSADAAALNPKPEFTPDKVVRIQLDALANNDTPHQDAGIETAFRFASPSNKQTTGPLNRFIRLVHNPIYKPMLDHQSARFGELVVEGTQAFLKVFLTSSNGERVGYMFILGKQEGGAYDQCWMTEAVMRFKVTAA